MKNIQPSMVKGELSPGLHGRIDTAAYPTALKTCLNFITRATGGVVKRPGYRFCGYTKTDDIRTRIIPFVYSTDVAYMIEMGAGYFRFWVNGAPLLDGGIPVEVVNPYSWDDIIDVRYTQSADVLYLVHAKHAPSELRRTSSTSFVLKPFDFKHGPFRSLNPNAAAIIAMSVATGEGILSANVAAFKPEMVGSFVMLEEKELKAVRPWEPIERNITVGSMRRSDGKTYKAVTLPPSNGSVGTPYHISGNTRPTHEFGRAWDGPGDVRSDSVNSYGVGIEWEYQNGGYGVVKILEYISPTQVRAVVAQQIPQSIVGTAPSPSNTWTLSGDGSTKAFPIAGASNPSNTGYAVSVNGNPVVSNPYESPTTGGGGPGGGGGAPGGGNHTQDYWQLEP